MVETRRESITRGKRGQSSRSSGPAVELAEKVEKTTSRDAAYDHIAEELINAGRLDEGKAIALRIQDERKRSDRLGHHLSTSVKSKDGAKSIDAAMAEAATREEKVSVGMLKFAELVEQREIEKAEALIVTLVKIIEDSPSDPSPQTRASSTIRSDQESLMPWTLGSSWAALLDGPVPGSSTPTVGAWIAS